MHQNRRQVLCNSGPGLDIDVAHAKKDTHVSFNPDPCADRHDFDRHALDMGPVAVNRKYAF
jgi:hypothetical protein